MDPNDETVAFRTSKDENEEKNCRSLLLKETPIEFRPTLEQAGSHGSLRWTSQIEDFVELSVNPSVDCN